MAMGLMKLRDALVEAGASPQKATEAAEEVAGFESRFDAVDARLAAFGERLTALEGRVNLLTWMVGGLYVIGAPSLWLLLRIAAKVGALG